MVQKNDDRQGSKVRTPLCCLSCTGQLHQGMSCFGKCLGKERMGRAGEGHGGMGGKRVGRQ